MILVYLTIGILFLFTPLFSDTILPRQRIIIGILCVIYGLFRSYRAYVIYKKDNENEDGKI